MNAPLGPAGLRLSSSVSCMREFRSGLLLGSLFVMISIGAFLGGRAMGIDDGWIEMAVMLLPISCGVLYRKWYGPMIWAPDGNGPNRIIRHLFGFGLPVGALSFWAGHGQISAFSPITQFFILALALGLSGLKVAGQYLVGSWIGEKCGYS